MRSASNTRSEEIEPAKRTHSKNNQRAKGKKLTGQPLRVTCYEKPLSYLPLLSKGFLHRPGVEHRFS